MSTQEKSNVTYFYTALFMSLISVNALCGAGIIGAIRHMNINLEK